jgi:hypothetical protein
MGRMIHPAALNLPHLHGIGAGILAGALGGTSVLLGLRGWLHLRLRPTVLPISDAPAVRLTTLLLGLSSGALGRTKGWALQFSLGLIGTAGARYVTYPSQNQIEVVGLQKAAVDDIVSRLMAVVWSREQDSQVLGPVPLITVRQSPVEPRTVWLNIEPATRQVLTTIRFGLARRFRLLPILPHPVGLLFLIGSAICAILAWKLLS